MKFSINNALKFSMEGVKGWSYNSKDEFEDMDAAFMEIGDKNHGKVRTKRSDRVYYVTEGSGIFIIDGKEIEVDATDVVIVPKNTIYDFRAKSGTIMKLFLVQSPAFDPKAEEIINS